jgi:uncharacterized protein (DUF1778 family)
MAQVVRGMSGTSKDKAREEQLEAPISRDQKALFQRATELGVIAESQTIRLGAEDSRAFREALLNPRKPNARLKKAAQRYLKLTGD